MRLFFWRRPVAQVAQREVFVYFAVREEKHRLLDYGRGWPEVKIGSSVDPRRRVRQLSTGSDLQLRLVAMARGGRELETALHRRFRSRRLRGEWFDGSVLWLLEAECCVGPVEGDIDDLVCRWEQKASRDFWRTTNRAGRRSFLKQRNRKGERRMAVSL